jgi:hypothetical protein
MNMKAMRKCDDEIYQLAKDQALVKKLKKTKDLGLLFMSSGCNVRFPPPEGIIHPVVSVTITGLIPLLLDY